MLFICSPKVTNNVNENLLTCYKIKLKWLKFAFIIIWTSSIREIYDKAFQSTRKGPLEYPKIMQKWGKYVQTQNSKHVYFSCVSHSFWRVLQRCIFIILIMILARFWTRVRFSDCSLEYATHHYCKSDNIKTV